MNASELMTTDVKSCGTNDSLQRAAQIMWESDCGVVPVVDSEGRVVGIVTDRDICMSAYTQGLPLWQIPVSDAMAKHVHGVREDDPLEAVEQLMRRVRVRRVPVLDAKAHLKGILSLNDLARHAHRSTERKSNGLTSEGISQTLAAICQPRTAMGSTEATISSNAAQPSA
jgi:CBS domain-containing protein